MSMPAQRVLVRAAAYLLAGTAVLAPAAAAYAEPEVVSVGLHEAVRDLPRAGETRAGYDRDKFNHWIDADGDCRDTRDEVLAAESLVAVDGCDIQAGSWRSSYDGATTKDSTAFDIDHLVPLAEAWDSGAKRWTAGTRERFANDLKDRRTLVAVSASANRSKGDRDPAEWMPELATCRYVRQWVAVKLRWQLTVNAAEQRFLVDTADDCKDVVITVRRASVHEKS